MSDLIRAYAVVYFDLAIMNFREKRIFDHSAVF